jgi:aspartate racemase
MQTSSSQVKVLGILGGMGPLASADFYLRVTELTAQLMQAQNDAAHLPIIVWSDPRFADRNAAIFGTGPSPRDEMIAACRKLVLAGAQYIAIACNTAHAWWPDLVQALPGVPVLHIVDATLAALQREAPQAKRVGLLATVGTLKAGIYVQRALRSNTRIDWLMPDSVAQEALVMKGIRAVKAADLALGTACLEQAAQELIEQGAEALIAACTEVPIALKHSLFSIPLIDSTAALARECVAHGFGLSSPLAKAQFCTE